MVSTGSMVWTERVAATSTCLPLLMLAFVLGADAAHGQVAIELSYGADRGVDSSSPERDGWLNGTVEWMFPFGLGLGIGTDHQFEGASIAFSDHLGWAIYVSSSYEYPLGTVAPFVRGGLGVGRAPCTGDTCGDGAYLRGSAGLRIRVFEKVRLSGELGISRVSGPFAGAGLSFRP